MTTADVCLHHVFLLCLDCRLCSKVYSWIHIISVVFAAYVPSWRPLPVEALFDGELSFVAIA